MSKAWLVALFLVGCGGSTSNIPKACSDLAAAECQKRSSCTNGTGIVRTWGDMATCLAREELGCSVGLNAPGSGATDASVEACVAAFATYACSDYLNNNPPAACIHTGTKAAGAPCAFNGQCQTGYCNSNKTATCGTCGDAPPVGASCRNSNCALQQQCAVRVLTCATIPGVGDACDNNASPCGADLACVGNSNGNPGTCMTGIATANAACGGTLGGCDGTMGLSCEGTSPNYTCMPYAEAADGAACGSMSGTFVGCAGGGDCYTSTGIAQAGQAGNCKAPAADGAACDILLGPPCLSPARCVVAGGGTSGTCTIPSAATCGS